MFRKEIGKATPTTFWYIVFVPLVVLFELQTSELPGGLVDTVQPSTGPVGQIPRPWNGRSSVSLFGSVLGRMASYCFG